MSRRSSGISRAGARARLGAARAARCCVLSGLIALLGSEPALAQTGTDSSAADVAAARALGAEGVTLARAGDCPAAIDKLTRAEALFHAPSILVELGYCQCELGRLVEGTEALNRVVRENLGSAPPRAFVDAQARAKTLLSQYTPKLANLVINVVAPEGATYQVTVDGKPVPLALVGVARPSDPGSHEVAAGGQGLEAAKENVTLEAGGSSDVTLTLVAAPEPPVAASTAERPADAAAPTTPPISDSHRSEQAESPRWPIYVGFGVGAVGLGLGTYFGLSALGAQGDLDELCRSGSCPNGTQSDIDGMERDANLATVGFAVGLIGAGVGLYFLLQDDPPQQAARCSQAPCLEPVVGLGQLGMKGAF